MDADELENIVSRTLILSGNLLVSFSFLFWLSNQCVSSPSRLGTIYIIGSVLSVSSLLNVFPQTLLNRSQGVKLAGCLMGEQFKKDNIPIVRIDRSHRARRIEKWGRAKLVAPDYKGNKKYEGGKILCLWLL